MVLQASDPLSQAGLTALLQSAPEISLLRPAERNDAHVLVFAYEQVSAEVVTVLRRTALETGLPVVLVVNAITESELLVAIENRVVAILPRGAVSAERLVHSVTTAAAGGGVLPPNMVGELLKHIERLQREVLAPNGLNASGLTPREVDVLRLMADGKDTQEIAGELCYSERTVKNVIHNLTHRLKLRNRSHAVAYALRAGMI
ncbi:helix-turn-helix transcriptional regulator [Paractinoplanes brasiliensis]|nr:helix-turn-helix transcriptional regulator [Actinoplanes brasiliensis]